MCNITHDSVLLTNDYVSGNLRLVFKYTPPDIYEVDLIDYPLIKKMKMNEFHFLIEYKFSIIIHINIKIWME